MTTLSLITWKVTDGQYQRSSNRYKVTFFDNRMVLVEVFVAETADKNGTTRAGHWRRVSDRKNRTAYGSALSHCRADLARLALRDKHPDALILHPLFNL